MLLDWQSLAAWALVAAAAVYLVRVSYRALVKPRGAGCGGCGTCPSDKASSPSVVQIESLINGSAARKPQDPIKQR